MEMSTQSTDVARDPAHPGPDTVENIQALRGIAALLVVWAHIKSPIEKLCPDASNFPGAQSVHGAIGVDLFFVISGFVISLTACKRHHRPNDFILARLARVSPLYLIYVLLFLAAKGALLGKTDSFSAIWNGFFYLPIFDWKDFSWPPGGLGWSLSFEMWFYVVFTLLLFVQPPKKVATILPLLFIVGAPLDILYRGDWYFPTFMFHPLTLNFAFGCIIFQLQRLISGRVTWCLLVIGMLWALLITRHSGDLSYPKTAAADYAEAWIRLLYWGVPCALIAAALVGLERNRLFVMPSALVWVGGISYSLYLSHQASIELLARLGAHGAPHNRALLIIAFPAFCIFNAWLCWKWVERPLTIKAQGWARLLSQGGLAKQAVTATTGISRRQI